MSIKQFLKPDWRKIVVFVLLVVIFFQYFPLPSWSLCEEIICPDNKYYYVSWEYGTCYKCGTISWSEQLLSDYYYPIMFAGFMINYLLSCFIVWIYDKLRKGRKK